MPEAGRVPRPSISEELLLSRLAQSEQMREFFMQMWLQNPQLARQAGAKVLMLLTPLESVSRSASG